MIQTPNVQEVIICEMVTKGSGKDTTSPIRSIKQVYDKGGILIAEADVFTLNIEQVVAAVNLMRSERILLTEKTNGEILTDYFKI